jgi:hypothetical protein
MIGYSGFSNPGWEAFGYPGHPPDLSFYAISAAITDVPEPATARLIALPLAVAFRRLPVSGRL